MFKKRYKCHLITVMRDLQDELLLVVRDKTNSIICVKSEFNSIEEAAIFGENFIDDAKNNRISNDRQTSNQLVHWQKKTA